MARTKYKDTTAANGVLASIYNNPSLLEEDGRHFFKAEDFTDELHRIFLGVFQRLYINNGVKKFSISLVEDMLQQYPESLATYKVRHGVEWLQRAEEGLHDLSEGFEFYYQTLKKYSLLREYEKIGLPVAQIYDPDELDLKKRQEQAEKFAELSLEEIALKFENELEYIHQTCIDNAMDESSLLGEGIEDVVYGTANVIHGMPFYGEYMDCVTNGMQKGKFFVRSAATGVGKALPNSTVIPTPKGWRKVQDIKVGDYLFDAFGKPTLVKGVYPQGQKEVWEITFKDGRKAKCCEEHLWSYCTESQRKKSKEQRRFFTKTLKELTREQLYTRGHGYHVLVPMQKAVQYETKEYYVKPYSFGLLLGDGSFRYDKTNKSLQYSSEDNILPEAIAKEMGWGVKKNSKFNYNWTFKWLNNETHHPNVWVEEVLKDYPELWNIKSEQKFIPQEYLQGDVQQRLDLLNGLLDSDGSIDKQKGRVSFWTVSPYLRDNVTELCNSLGFKTSQAKDTHKDSLPLYKIEIMGNPEDKVKLFRLSRKKEIIEAWYNNGKRKESNLFNPIISIDKLNYSEEMTCFYVDNEEHLFLMNDFIVTHNTRSMVADACYLACDEIYEHGVWKDIEDPIPCLFIATEQEKYEIQTMALAFISGIDEDKIKAQQWNDFGGDYADRIKHAMEVLQRSRFYIECIPDFTTKDIENCIKRHLTNPVKQVQYIFFDYIFTSPKMMREMKNELGAMREDQVLGWFSTKLKEICVKYNVFILTSTQLNKDWKDAHIPDQNLLRGAKSIADKCDWASILLDVTEEDKEAIESFVKELGVDMPNVKMSIYKNRGGKYTKGYLWMLADKSTCRFNGLFWTGYDYKPYLTVNNMRFSKRKAG